MERIQRQMKFSVIIPVYNVAEYLQPCLDSVLGQTVPDWECICVDDGSTDDSGKILDEFAARDSRIRVVHKSNGGVASARNTALDVISGDWFLFLDADDVWSPQLLEVCRAGIRFEPEASIVQFADRHFAANEQCSWKKLCHEPQFVRVDLTRPYSRRWLGFTAPREAFKFALLSDIRQRPYCVGEDLLYMTECALRSHIMVKTDVKLYGYRDRMTSVTRCAMSQKKVLDHIRANVDIIRLLENSHREISRETRKELCNVLTEDVAAEYLKLTKSDRIEVRKEWVNALRFIGASHLPYGLHKMRIRLMAQMPYIFVWYVLGRLPRRLKEMGFHR